jgi:hypothetical protein
MAGRSPLAAKQKSVQQCRKVVPQGSCRFLVAKAASPLAPTCVQKVSADCMAATVWAVTLTSRWKGCTKRRRPSVLAHRQECRWPYASSSSAGSRLSRTCRQGSRTGKQAQICAGIQWLWRRGQFTPAAHRSQQCQPPTWQNATHAGRQAGRRAGGQAGKRPLPHQLLPHGPMQDEHGQDDSGLALPHVELHDGARVAHQVGCH